MQYSAEPINFGIYIMFKTDSSVIPYSRQELMNEKKASRPGWITIILILVVGILLIAGCTTNAPSGGSGLTPQDTGRTQPPTASVTPAVTLDRPAPGSVKAVDFNLMIPLLPDAPVGWTAKDPEGIAIPGQDGSWTIASRSYSSGENKRAEVSIMDSAYYEVGAWGGWASQTEMMTTDGYIKSGSVAGFPSWESYDKNARNYQTWVGLDNRFMVTVSVDNSEKSDLDSFVSSINYRGITALE